MPYDSDISAAEFKRLTAKRDRLKREVRALRPGTRDRLRAEAELGDVERKLDRVHKASGGSRGMVVTEHALVRYVERVMGVSPEEFAERVLPAAMQRSLVAAGVRDATVPVPVSETSTDVSHQVVIVDGVVVSVLAAGDRARTCEKPVIVTKRLPRSQTALIERDQEDLVGKGGG